MLTKTAYGLINIKSDVDYLTQEELKKGPIFRIHCVKGNQSEVKIKSYTGDFISFPPNSFVCGAIYDIMIKKMIFDESMCAFIGYRMKDLPPNMR